VGQQPELAHDVEAVVRKAEFISGSQADRVGWDPMTLDGKGRSTRERELHAVRRYVRMALHDRLERPCGSRSDVEHGLRVTSSRAATAQVWPPSSLSCIASHRSGRGFRVVTVLNLRRGLRHSVWVFAMAISCECRSNRDVAGFSCRRQPQDALDAAPQSGAK
jgi:hypothetical protein